VIELTTILLLACCSDDLIPDCYPAPSPTLVVRTSGFPSGVVTTAGACTDVHCVAPVEAGCERWEGEMKSRSAGDRCVVTLRLPDGRGFSRETLTADVCGGPQLRGVLFAPP